MKTRSKQFASCFFDTSFPNLLTLFNLQLTFNFHSPYTKSLQIIGCRISSPRLNPRHNKAFVTPPLKPTRGSITLQNVTFPSKTSAVCYQRSRLWITLNLSGFFFFSNKPIKERDNNRSKLPSAHVRISKTVCAVENSAC